MSWIVRDIVSCVSLGTLESLLELLHPFHGLKHTTRERENHIKSIIVSIDLVVRGVVGVQSMTYEKRGSEIHGLGEWIWLRENPR